MTSVIFLLIIRCNKDIQFFCGKWILSNEAISMVHISLFDFDCILSARIFNPDIYLHQTGGDTFLHASGFVIRADSGAPGYLNY